MQTGCRHKGTFHRFRIGQMNINAVYVQIMQINQLDASESLQSYLNLLNDLQQAMNRKFYLGLIEYEEHIALYPAGAHYSKHLSRFQGDDIRTVTTILHLNDDRPQRDGGLLILGKSDDEKDCEDLLLIAVQFVTFPSSQSKHEVMPAPKGRLRSAGWFK